VIIFGTVRFLSKKSNQIKKNLRKKPKSVQTGRFRFGSVFRTKTDSNWFGSVWLSLARFWLSLARFWLSLARFWLGFFWFDWVFSVWLGFSSVVFWFGSVFF
jgi:hypothetical protein